MGNRLTKTDNVTGNETSSFDNANRLLARGSNVYTNDADGNTLTGGGRTNTWDSQNRLATCSFGGNSSSYIYGADGYRHRSVVNGTSTDFALDGDNVVREIRAGVNQATYFGSLYHRNDTSNTVRWYIQDGLGSVLAEVDPTGNVTGTRKLDVYGISRGTGGTLTSKHGFVGSLGHTSEPETGLIFMRARYYDPVAGRFVSEDSALHGVNWYTYSSGDPVNRADRTGKNDQTLIELAKEVFFDEMQSKGVNPALAAYIWVHLNPAEQVMAASRLAIVRDPYDPTSSAKSAAAGFLLAHLGAALIVAIVYLVIWLLDDSNSPPEEQGSHFVNHTPRG